MLGVMRLIFDDDCESMSGDDDFFSVARTMPLVAASSSQRCWGANERYNAPLIPSEVTPWLTAFKAYSVQVLDAVCYKKAGVVISLGRVPICTSFPLHEC